jgi:hypothetical protein
MGPLKRQLVIWSAIAATTAVLPGLAMADNASPDFGGRHGRGQDQKNSKLSVAGRALSRAEKQKDAYGMEIRGRSGDKPTDASGMVRFAHRGDTASEGLVGEITCLSKDSAGVVSVTGTIKRSAKRDSKGDRQFKPGAGTTAASDDDGTALLDELAPLEADETAALAADDPAPALPGAPAAPGMPSAPGDPNKKHDHRGGGELAGKDFAFTIDVPGKPQHFSQPTIGDKGTLAACSGGGAPVEVTRGRFRTREAGSDNSRGDNGDRGDRRRGGRQ